MRMVRSSIRTMLPPSRWVLAITAQDSTLGVAGVS